MGKTFNAEDHGSSLFNFSEQASAVQNQSKPSATSPGRSPIDALEQGLKELKKKKGKNPF